MKITAKNFDVLDVFTDVWLFFAYVSWEIISNIRSSYFHWESTSVLQAVYSRIICCSGEM